ncbi:hypothetical protein BCR36DRAFT_585357 [Piromyces finnis]|uniref:HAD-like protein n=1 Tax=Piromyces finnis TaxID=1754191 RepID=A0A1Y1V340_9FUNG|nr:hypothetical protein BCR36DRAFT_585357 [Piromyces finnis]|eukprot:ORX46211.1 hypothetical protein BCR36DRAFT_585357 [Piromyces finnis]
MDIKLPEASKIKVIATDLDGTLLNSKGRVSERNKTVIRKILEKYPDIHFVIASGRGRPATMRVRQDIGIMDRPNTESILCNGCIIYDSCGNILYQELLPNDLILKIHKIVPSLSESCFEYTSGDDAIFFKEKWSKFAHEMYDEQTITEDMDEFSKKIEANETKINKVCFMVSKPSEINEIVEALDNLKKEYNMELSYTTPIFIEYMPSNINKGSGLIHLMNILNVKKEEIIAFGDGGNDFEFLQNAGWPVAMANANEKLKSYACLITKSNEEDGVADLLEKIFLKEELMN